MFCPNCGNDCGDSNFCSNCGTRMKVPTKQEIPLPVNTKKGSIQIPTTMGFSGDRGIVALYDSAVSISTGGLNSKKRTLIPFDQLDTVIYVRPAAWQSGALLLRGGPNSTVPIPELRHMHLDDAAVTFHTDSDNLFYHIFYMLKAVAPASAKFEIIITDSKIRSLNALSQSIDMDYYWREYAPLRSLAIERIRGQYGIDKKTAQALVDREFDFRQNLRYEADPLDAIRDLNVAVDRRKNACRLQGELREAQKQEEIERSLRHIQWMMLDDK